MPLLAASFASIVASDPAEYAAYQVKFTYTGTQTASTPTLLLVGISRAPAVGEFEPYRSAGVHYGNDDFFVVEHSISGSTIQRFVQGLQERPPLQVLGGSPTPVISLMIERGAPPSELIFEHLANGVETSQLLDVLEGAARPEPAAVREAVREFRNRSVGPH